MITITVWAVYLHERIVFSSTAAETFILDYLRMDILDIVAELAVLGTVAARPILDTLAA